MQSLLTKNINIYIVSPIQDCSYEYSRAYMNIQFPTCMYIMLSRPKVSGLRSHSVQRWLSENSNRQGVLCPTIMLCIYPSDIPKSNSDWFEKNRRSNQNHARDEKKT